MKKLLTLAFSLALLGLCAQDNPGRKFDWLSCQKAIAACAGQFHPDFSALNNQLKSEGAPAVFSYGYNAVGLTANGHLTVNRKGVFDGSFAFGWFLHQRYTAGTNDSLSYALRGWHVMTSLYGKDLIPGKTMALVLAPGFDWGAMKITRTVNGNSSLLRNGFIAPMARAELRFVIGPVALGARGSFRYDISSESWRQKRGPQASLPGTTNTGWGLEFFLGWGKAGAE